MADATLVYDDDCGFCTWWADLFDERTDVEIVGFEELTPGLRERLPDDYERCSHLVTDDGVYSCGASLEEALVRADLVRPLPALVEAGRTVEGYDRVRGRVYRLVADNRDLLGRVLSKTPPARRGASGREEAASDEH